MVSDEFRIAQVEGDGPVAVGQVRHRPVERRRSSLVDASLDDDESFAAVEGPERYDVAGRVHDRMLRRGVSDTVITENAAVIGEAQPRRGSASATRTARSFRPPRALLRPRRARAVW